MATMVNMIPVEAKTQVSPKGISKKSGTDSDKSAVGFAKVLDNQADKTTKNDSTENDNATASSLMLGMMGMALPTIMNVMSSNQKEDVLEAGGTTQADVATKDQLSGIGISTNSEMSQLQLAALLEKMTGENKPVDSKITNFTPVKFQELLNEQQLIGQVQTATDNSVSTVAANLTANKALLGEVASIGENNGVGNIKPFQTNNKKVNDSAQAIKSETLDKLGTNTTSALAELLNTDIKIVSTSQTMNNGENNLKTPQVVNVLDGMASDNKANAVFLAVKEQLSAEKAAPGQKEDNADTFVNVLNQQVIKNETVTVVSDVKQTQPVKDPYNITSQIVDQARLVTGQKNTEMIIQLKPEHLGELTLKVTVESGVVSASFHSNNSEVRNVIEATLSQLKQEMSNQGLKVENVSVYAGLGQFFSDGQRENQKKPEVKVQSKKTEEEFLEALEASSPVESVTDNTGVDYRI